MTDIENLRAEIVSLTVNKDQHADTLVLWAKRLDTLSSPWWKRLLFRLDGWPPWWTVAQKPRWRPWRRWWVS